MSNPSQAEGVELCFSLRPPCPSLPEFAFDGQVLEYSMYDVSTPAASVSAGISHSPSPSLPFPLLTTLSQTSDPYTSTCAPLTLPSLTFTFSFSSTALLFPPAPQACGAFTTITNSSFTG
ncbi:hypothetical protein V8C86DRAFT_3112347 [Haematococcus lacustris]